MAIKVGGTEVVDNNRQLKNIASVDATTVAALGTAGVGGGASFDATASGALANGNPVILNANGTVSKPALSISANDPATFGYSNGADVNGASTTQSMSAAYNSNTGTTGAGAFMTLFEDTSDSNILKVNMMTIRADGEFNIEGEDSVGTQVSGSRDADVCFSEPTNKFVVVYVHDGGNGTIRAATPAAARSVAFHSGYTFDSSGNTYAPRVATDNNNNPYNFVIAYSSTQDESLKVKPCQLNTSNNSFTLGSETTIPTGTYVSGGHTIVYDSTNDKFILVYGDTNDSGNVKVRVLTLNSSNNTLSVGSENELSTVTTSGSNHLAAVFTTGGKTVIACKNAADSSYLTTVVFTTSGTSGSFGTPQRVFARAASEVCIGYDNNTNRVGISFGDQSNSGFASFVTGSVGTTSLTFQSSNPATLNSTGRSATSRPSVRMPFSGTNTGAVAGEYSRDNKMMAFYCESNRARVQSVNLGTTTTSLTSSNYLGIADAAYSNGATATVQTMGAIDDAQSGMTIGAKQYVQSDGTIGGSADSPSVEAGLALSATKLLVKG